MSFAKTKTDYPFVSEVPRTCESNGSSEGMSLRGRLRRVRFILKLDQRFTDCIRLNGSVACMQS
jgi:hypothetical protein